MNYYIVPSASITLNNETVSAPKYFQTDFDSFVSIPFGMSGVAIVALDAMSSALHEEPDVIPFPDDLTATISDLDVAALDSYLGDAGVPYTWIIAGMSWGSLLRELAQIALLCQQINGATGQSVSQSASLSVKGGKVGTSSAQLLASTDGPFDLSTIDLNPNISTKAI